MKLTEKAIQILMNDISLRNNIALILKCSEGTVRRWINENEKSGDMTKFEVVRFLLKNTKLTQKELYQ